MTKGPLGFKMASDVGKASKLKSSSSNMKNVKLEETEKDDKSDKQKKILFRGDHFVSNHFCGLKESKQRGMKERWSPASSVNI